MELRASPVIQRFVPVVARLIPESLRQKPADLWKAENLVIASVMAILIMPAYGYFYHVLGDDVNTLLCMLATLGSLISLLILRWTQKVAGAREVLLITIYGLLIAMTCRLGGVSAPTVIWLAVCPLIATTAGGLRPALVWSGLTFLAVVVIHIMDIAGSFPKAVVTDMRILTTVSTISFVMTVAVFILVFYQVNSIAIFRLDQALTIIRDLAIRDELTGVFNRRELIRIAEQEKERFERHESPFCLCLIDVDYFKRINDTYGHAAGDQVLKRLAGKIREEIRSTDYFGRYGGEEFLLILVGSDAAAAASFSDRIREAIEALSFDNMPDIASVTISIGVAQYLSGETIEQTLTRADSALYLAKNAGRNRVAVDAS